MKKSITIFGLLCLLALSAGDAVAQDDPPPVFQKGKVFTVTEAKKFDYGTVENNVYANKLFGVRFTVPENWDVQPREYGEAVVENGSGSIKGKSAAMQKAIDESPTTTKILISLKNGIVGTFMLTAEPLGQKAAFITSGEDYLRASLNGFKQTVLPPGYEVVYEIKQDKLGANSLPYFEAKTTLVKQRFYGMMRNGSGLLFIVMYSEEADLETMREILKNADLTLK